MPKHISPEQERAIVRLYTQDRLPVAAVAREVGCSLQTVRGRLRKAGVEIERRNGRERRDIDEATRDEVVRLYVDHVPSTEIARRLNLPSVPFVYAVLKQRGIPAHTQHGRQVPNGTTHVTPDGYVLEKVPADWPYLKAMSGSGGNGRWIFQHRKVMAEVLGRPLLRRLEEVHHINGDRSDNRPENLELRRVGHGAGVVLRCRCCGSSDVEVAAPS